MKNLYIWIIALIIAIVFIFGIAYYKILDAVANALAFIISLTIIFLILILVIIFSQQDNEKRQHFKKSAVEIEEKRARSEEKSSPKKLRVDRKK